MKQHAHTRYNMELEDGETIPLPFQIDEDTATWTESANGLTGYLGALAHDDDASDPIQDFDNGELMVFDNRLRNSQARPDINDFIRLIRANPGHIVTIDIYEHGDRSYKVAHGPLTVADTKHGHHTESKAEKALDDASGYYIIPEDATDPLQYATSTMDEYTKWANGEVYGAFCWRYTRETIDDPWTLDESSRDSECWGFIGAEYAESERDERVTEAIQGDMT